MGGKTTWAGLCALALAIGVAVALAAAVIIIAIRPKDDQSAEFVAVITTLAGAAVGAVGTYLGTQVRAGQNGDTAPSGPAPDTQPPDGATGPDVPAQGHTGG